MNVRKLIPLLLCSVALTCFAGTSDNDSESSKETKVKKLDGTSILGIVEITDDYTIRVKSDSGIQNIPLALLSEKDFQKYGFQKDRSQDGRFWSERKQAVDSSESESESKNSASKNTAMEINLAQIAAFQPLIDAYEKSTGGKAMGATDKAKDGSQTSSEETFKPLFSKPGISNVAQPFTGFGNTLAPAATAGGTVISTVTSGASSLPVPSVPTLP